ncbi:MAG: hypothetical protein ACI4R9_07710 [Kiritimatiellia bacterium]
MVISRPGQAFMEMAVGMLATALVLAALFGCIRIILESMNRQRSLRAEAGRAAMASVGGDGAYSSAESHATIAVESFSAEYLFGSREIEVREEVHMPAMGIDWL